MDTGLKVINLVFVESGCCRVLFDSESPSESIESLYRSSLAYGETWWFLEIVVHVQLS